MNSTMNKKNLLGMTLPELKQVAVSLGMPSFAGGQMAKWIYTQHVSSIDEMTNISKANREKLNEHYQIGCAKPIDAQHSKDGTIKYLFPVVTTAGADSAPVATKFVETVYIPEDDRATLCVSCEVGCKMNCLFCQTGKQGFEGYLTATDILNQIYSLPERDKLTNIVFMGQGEPMDNLDNVLRATEILTASYGYAWSPKRITVSSVGLKDKLKRFLEESQCHVAISLRSMSSARSSCRQREVWRLRTSWNCFATTTSPISVASRLSISSSADSTIPRLMPRPSCVCSTALNAVSTSSASIRFPTCPCMEPARRRWRASVTISHSTVSTRRSAPAVGRTSLPPVDCSAQLRRKLNQNRNRTIP